MRVSLECGKGDIEGTGEREAEDEGYIGTGEDEAANDILGWYWWNIDIFDYI